MNTADDLATLAERFDLSDGDIADTADRTAADIKKLVELWQSQGIDQATATRTLRKIAARHGVGFPAQDGFTQRLNRMLDAGWWRRALRKRRRTVEHHAIQCGAVHRHAAPYVSPKALQRHDDGRRSMKEWLLSQELMNLGTGEVIPLDEVIASSQANPANRRMAMMARTKGIEAQAKAKGHEALFLTLTAPSRMHARHASGQAVEHHDGASPRQVQTYLNGVWRKAMRSMQRAGLAAYGLRTVEPHHDGCPHWHVLMFVAPEQSEAILRTLRAHALADSPDEPGAAEHRFRVERIDPAKGSALGYIAKYVSKSIDGEGIDTDDESGSDGDTASRRIVAWARLWGIRQFQFFGVPPITPARELYRLKDADTFDSEGLRTAHAACLANDHAAYLAACEAHAVTFALRYEERPSARYADEVARAIYGLCASTADLSQPLELTTRTEKWCIQPRQPDPAAAAVCPPWTRFNNCPEPVKSRAYGPPMVTATSTKQRPEVAPC